jgi:pseudaminic acid cytidylyltransferase
MKLAVIPARGGSKRIPRKNIKLFCGKPMIAWSIEAAIESQCFERIIVSTDDTEIAEIASAYGAQVPFTRPRELSDDYTGTTAVVAHATQWHNQNHSAQPATQVCCIYATAPFVRAIDLQRGLNLLHSTQADFAFAVASYAFPIQRALRITPDNRVTMFEPEHLNTRSQDLDEAWHDAGQFYWGAANAWLSNAPMFGPRSAPIPLQRCRVQDIDTAEDWERAEWLFKAQLGSHVHTKRTDGEAT